MRRIKLVFSICFIIIVGILYGGEKDGKIIRLKNKIVDNGPDNKKFNIVILSEGYKVNEMWLYKIQVCNFVDTLFKNKAFGPFKNAFNIYRADIGSEESGADKKAPCFSEPIEKKTYFDSYYCYVDSDKNATQRLIWSTNFDLIYKIVYDTTNYINVFIVLINDREPGGSGNQGYVFTSTEPGFENTIIHELGHAVAILGDEYEEYNCMRPESGEPQQINLTIKTNLEEIKWKTFISQDTNLPTWTNTNCRSFNAPNREWEGIIGLFQGGDRYTCGIYRPEADCLMRSLDKEFCSVCKEHIQKCLSFYLD